MFNGDVDYILMECGTFSNKLFYYFKVLSRVNKSNMLHILKVNNCCITLFNCIYLNIMFH